MVNIFSGSEIVKIGIQIEKNGRDFYNILDKRSKNKKSKEIFRYLAGEEEKHIKVFEQILSSAENYEPAESYPGEYLSYMKDLAGEYVFTQIGQGAKVAKKMKSERDAVNKGIGFEKDSIIFYEGIKKVVIGNNISLVDQLIAQEQLHLQKLVELKSVL
ncbi:MAG: ferritin family protein [Candidatus Omnitrophota bacterium]|jgi:rubrerythrin